MHALFDIGGTKTRVAVSGDLASFVEPVIFDTLHSYKEGIVAIADAIKKLSGGGHITGACGGIRGQLSADHSGMAHDDVLTDWQSKALTHDLGAHIGAPVLLENDAALVGLGEAHFGAGKGFPIVAYHTVSTGMGGARIVHGKIDVNSMGFEPGHQTIDADHTLCPTCGTESVDLEDYISGSAIEARFHKKPYEIEQKDAVWDELAHWLAHGLKNTIVYWSPDVIVLGGSMIVGDPRILLSDIQKHTAEVVGDLMLMPPPIKDALLGDGGGLYGAMVLLEQEGDKKAGAID